MSVQYPDFRADLNERFEGARRQVRKKIEEYERDVTALIAKLPEDSPQKEEVLTRLETFTEQAAKKKPLGDVLKVTGKGLVEAAKTVAEMIGPITVAVTGVLKLFGLSLV